MINLILNGPIGRVTRRCGALLRSEVQFSMETLRRPSLCHSRFCRCAAAAEFASWGWTSSCLCSVCSETRRGSPGGWGRSSPPAAPSSGRPVWGWRCSRCAGCEAASRWAQSGHGSSSQTACARGFGGGRDAGPKLGLWGKATMKFMHVAKKFSNFSSNKIWYLVK